MRGIIYDCVEHVFIEVEVELLDGCARSGQYVLFDDGTMSFCCSTDYENKIQAGDPMMEVFDVGFLSDAGVDDLNATDLEPYRTAREYSTFEVSVFDARPCAIYAM